MLRNYLLILALLLFAASCKPPVKAEQLYGKWKYVKVENPNSHPPDSVKAVELEMEEPYIQFFKGDSLQIWWGHQVLSHGTYHLEDNNIRFKEIMPGGKTREFPFIVTKITDKDLIFETRGEDGARVTAVRE